MKRILGVMLGACLIFSGTTPVSAKPLARIIRDIGLTPDDFSMMGDAAKGLYATASPRPGKVVSWSNADSKSHGRVKLAAMRDGCAFLQHFVFPKGAEKPKEIRLRVCKNAQGKWVLQP